MDPSVPEEGFAPVASSAAPLLPPSVVSVSTATASAPASAAATALCSSAPSSAAQLSALSSTQRDIKFTSQVEQSVHTLVRSLRSKVVNLEVLLSKVYDTEFAFDYATELLIAGDRTDNLGAPSGSGSAGAAGSAGASVGGGADMGFTATSSFTATKPFPYDVELKYKELLKLLRAHPALLAEALAFWDGGFSPAATSGHAHSNSFSGPSPSPNAGGGAAYAAAAARSAHLLPSSPVAPSRSLQPSAADAAVAAGHSVVTFPRSQTSTGGGECIAIHPLPAATAAALPVLPALRAATIASAPAPAAASSVYAGLASHALSSPAAVAASLRAQVCSTDRCEMKLC